MSPTTQSFAGVWKKITTSPCSREYPDQIEFRDNGLYFGRREPEGTYTTWDAGKFTVTSEGSVDISTATDEIVPYRYSFSGDVLRFVDRDNCTFEYRRSAG